MWHSFLDRCSGGSLRTDPVEVYLVEAVVLSEAVERLERIGIYAYGESCECCGSDFAINGFGVEENRVGFATAEEAARAVGASGLLAEKDRPRVRVMPADPQS